MSINKVSIMGNLGQDVELRYLANATAVATLKIATNERWRDSSGNKQERVTWHSVSVFGPTAENCAKFLSKGRSVFVEGKLRNRMYEKDGVKHYVTDIVANPGGVQFLGSSKKNETVQAPQQTQSDEIQDTDIPL